MGGIKYYQLAKGEEMPDEFCVVMDVDGEPSEYMFYVPEAENAKLRELCIDFASMLTYAELDGLRVEATIGGVTKTYDASELCDKVEEIWDKGD